MQCSNCGAENENGTRFCATCGTPLQSQMRYVPAPPPKSHWGRYTLFAIVGGFVGVCAICAVCGLLLMIGQRGTAPTPVAPDVSDVPVDPNAAPSLADIRNAVKQLTEVKRNAYYQSLVGKTVHWSGTVADVSNTGEVHVRIMNTFGYDVAITAVPKTVSAPLNLKDTITFDGTITEVSDILGSGLPIITIKYSSLSRK